MEGSQNFMPRLWEAIEARRTTPLFAVRRMARWYVAAAVAAAFLIGLVLIPRVERNHVGGYYADVVASHHSATEFEYAAIVPGPNPRDLSGVPVR